MTNRMNFGDELLFAAHERLLGRRLAHLPIGGRNRLLRLRSALGSRTPLLLGGGTLIGRPAYRRALEAGLDVGRDPTIAVLGAGVSAPAATGKSSLDELRAWRPVLERMPVVRVRGPRSRRYLADIGVDSVIVGDPALALLRPLASAEPRPAEDPRAGRVRIGVNVARVRAMGSTEPEILACLGSIAAAAPHAVEVIVLCAAPYDRSAAGRFAAATMEAGLARSTARVVELPRCDHRDLRQLFGSLSLVIGVRLHVLVAAAALGVPAVALAYEDKCWDFQDSVSATGATIDLASVDRDWLSDRIVAGLADQRPDPAVDLAVDGLVRAQHDAAADVIA
ncbi:MAG: polysaccharide pyruvyl transferase family protein, partial [Acidimicrobiales bacterium]